MNSHNSSKWILLIAVLILTGCRDSSSDHILRGQEVAYWDLIDPGAKLRRPRPPGEEEDPFGDIMDSAFARLRCGYAFHSTGELDYFCYGPNRARYLQTIDDVIYLSPGYRAVDDTLYLDGGLGLVFRRSKDSLWIQYPHNNDTFCLVYSIDQKSVPITLPEPQMGELTKDDDPSHYSLRCAVRPDSLVVQVGKLRFAPLFEATKPRQLQRLQMAADSVRTVWHGTLEKNVAEYHYGASSVWVDGNKVVDYHGHDTNIGIPYPRLKVGDSLMVCCPEEILGKPGRVPNSGMVYITLCGTDDHITVGYQHGIIQWFLHSSLDTIRQ